MFERGRKTHPLASSHPIECRTGGCGNRLGFDLLRVMRTKYRIDDYQQNYFVIDSFEDLLKQTLETDFAPLYAALERLPDLEIADILPEDRVLTRGTQAYAEARMRA